MARTDKRPVYVQHGLSHHKLYHIWYSMIFRCNNPNHRQYALYGGRGITVCEAWLNIANFIADMAPTYIPGMTLDRIDNNAGYAPNNCRWATHIEQGNNKNNNKLITINDVTDTCANWRRKYGIKKPTYQKRIRLGWTPEAALITPIDESFRTKGSSEYWATKRQQLSNNGQ
jgi:hypothetical protein